MSLDPEITQALYHFGGVGMVAWLLYYTFVHTIPEMVQELWHGLREDRRELIQDVKDLSQTVQKLSSLIESLVAHECLVVAKGNCSDAHVHHKAQGDNHEH